MNHYGHNSAESRFHGTDPETLAREDLDPEVDEPDMDDAEETIIAQFEEEEAQVRKDQAEIAARRARWAKQHSHLTPLVASLKAIGSTFRMTDHLDITITGGKAKLTAAFRVLGKHGFRLVTERPKEGESYWSGFFDRDLSRVWLTFSSTVCKRVKVGTKMKEVDVYETVCEEEPE